MIQTYVFSKSLETVTGTITLGLSNTELIQATVIGSVTPNVQPTVTLGIVSGLDNPLQFSISGGSIGTTYGIPVTVTTNLRTIQITIAVPVTQTDFNPYRNTAPESYQDLIGDIGVGKSALATTFFQFPSGTDVSGGYVTWDLLDSEGVIYGNGNAFEYKILPSSIATTVRAESIVNVPSSIPPTVDTPYQLRYTLVLPSGAIYRSFETLTVVGFDSIQLGTQDSVELVGDNAVMSLVTQSLFQNYVMEVYHDNSIIATSKLDNPERVSGGYFIGGTVNTFSVPVSLSAYAVVFKYWNNPVQIFRETANLWVVNTSILMAIDDVKSKINKARQTLYGTSDTQFPVTEIMKWLRRGADKFNGAYGIFTSFDMTNAKGPVREFWMMCAELAALESQYLAEGEKAFNFSGSAISLDVDRTSFLDSAASRIQGQLDAELKLLKQNLIIKGITAGDGSGPHGNGNFNVSSRGSMGQVGISITPASLYGGGFGSALLR